MDRASDDAEESDEDSDSKEEAEPSDDEISNDEFILKPDEAAKNPLVQ